MIDHLVKTSQNYLTIMERSRFDRENRYWLKPRKSRYFNRVFSWNIQKIKGLMGIRILNNEDNFGNEIIYLLQYSHLFRLPFIQALFCIELCISHTHTKKYTETLTSISTLLIYSIQTELRIFYSICKVICRVENW